MSGVRGRSQNSYAVTHPLAILKLYLPCDHPILLDNRHQTINDYLRLINYLSGQCPVEIYDTCKHERSCAQPEMKFSASLGRSQHI